MTQIQAPKISAMFTVTSAKNPVQLMKLAVFHRTLIILFYDYKIIRAFWCSHLSGFSMTGIAFMSFLTLLHSTRWL